MDASACRAAASEIRFYDFASRQSRLIQSLGDENVFVGFAVSADRKSFLYTVRHDIGQNLIAGGKLPVKRPSVTICMR